MISTVLQTLIYSSIMGFVIATNIAFEKSVEYQFVLGLAVVICSVYGYLQGYKFGRGLKSE